jgi:hypothetical protein
MKIVETLPIGEVVPGMYLAQAVMDDGGRVLVPAGAEVSESMLNSLQRRDVAELTVEREVEEDPAEREAFRAKLVEHLDRLFRKAGDAAETRVLYQSILDFRLEHRS